MGAPSRVVRIASIPAMFVAGAMIAVQAQVNGRLATALGGTTSAGLTAAVLAFGSGLVLVTLITLSSPARRAGIPLLRGALRDGTVPRVAVLGGLCGAFLVAAQGLTVATIGVALFSVAVTAGQSSSSLAVDHAGLGPGGHHPWSLPRGVAAAFAVIAVALAAGERLVESFSLTTAGLAVLPLLAGAGMAVQAAFNGRVSAIAGPWVSSLNNFVIGFIGLVAVWLIALAIDHDLRPLPGQWWMYVGGVLGMGFIWLSAALVRVHGVLVLGLCVIAGQVITALVIELVVNADSHVGPVGVAAGGLTVVGVLVALWQTGHGHADD
ncbi:DMT family transporter [Nocardioides ginsengisoli]|uniref:DMT family transporter n=1 Tax=Nocardioides ginsengisoli TaxID=363868 RepID=A0ABW3W3N2_9ACTN